MLYQLQAARILFDSHRIKIKSIAIPVQILIETKHKFILSWNRTKQKETE